MTQGNPAWPDDLSQWCADKQLLASNSLNTLNANTLSYRTRSAVLALHLTAAVFRCDLIHVMKWMEATPVTLSKEFKGPLFFFLIRSLLRGFCPPGFILTEIKWAGFMSQVFLHRAEPRQGEDPHSCLSVSAHRVIVLFKMEIIYSDCCCGCWVILKHGE